ncbi:MAG: bifunctional 5,10-methylenetetrahydrofolate dehydrogenase/5,10-methenyltetrahydrofolate cyclohydrolase [Bacillota bacterium]
MSAQIINGEQVARDLRRQLKEEVALLKQEKGITPGLVIIVVKSPFARVHVARLKERTCQQLGIKCQVIYLPETTTDEEIIYRIERLNNDKSVHGINIHPLTPHLSHTLISQQVDPAKDVEGLHFLNMGDFLIGRYRMVPFVAKGVMKLIESTGIQLAGKRAVVVGRSQLVGKPLAFLLLEKNATVSICHSVTTDLASYTRWADLLVVAAGKPRTINSRMVKEGAVVVDVGVNQVGSRLIGDVDYEEVKNIASWITPVPGGVGPVTIAMLLDNLIKAARYA